MTTTIQVSENLTISKYMEINGVRCEVEAASFTPAIFEGQANEELLKVMADELIERNVIKEERGQYYFCESGEPLIPDEDWEDEDQTTESNLLIEVASAIRELRRGSDREVKEDGEVVGYWQTPEFIEYLLEIAARCEQGSPEFSFAMDVYNLALDAAKSVVLASVNIEKTQPQMATLITEELSALRKEI